MVVPTSEKDRDRVDSTLRDWLSVGVLVAERVALMLRDPIVLPDAVYVLVEALLTDIEGGTERVRVRLGSTVTVRLIDAFDVSVVLEVPVSWACDFEGERLYVNTAESDSDVVSVLVVVCVVENDPLRLGVFTCATVTDHVPSVEMDRECDVLELRDRVGGVDIDDVGDALRWLENVTEGDVVLDRTSVKVSRVTDWRAETD